MKRILTLICILGLAIALAGCGGGGGKGGGGKDDADVKKAINEVLNYFRIAVEEYNVREMLGYLDENDFKLTIAEKGSDSYEKDYATLKTELEEDEAKQLRWRNNDPLVGYGYILTMEFGTISFSDVSSSGAYVVVPFTIKEEAEGISQVVTDTGSMICEMVYLNGQWRCRRMTINYDTTGAIQLTSKMLLGASVSKRSANGGGFGFAMLDLGNID